MLKITNEYYSKIIFNFKVIINNYIFKLLFVIILHNSTCSIFSYLIIKNLVSSFGINICILFLDLSCIMGYFNIITIL